MNLESGASRRLGSAERDPRSVIADEPKDFASSPRVYRPDIDGLRAIAVASVVFFHAGLWPFRSGYVGVDVFFVISGYLVGGIVIRDVARGSFSFISFYARRARRILPALFVVILATCLIGWFLLDAHEYKDVGSIGALALVGASNINFWQFQDYFASDSRSRVFLMTWSLGVEEQFYLLLPLLMLLIHALAPRRLILVIAVVGLASFGISLAWTANAPEAAFYLLPARAWELGIGVALAGVGDKAGREIPQVSQDTLAFAGLAALCIAIVAFDEHTPFPGVAALLPVLGAVALLSAPRGWINRKVLSSRPAVFVGLVSYSWYLWHWPLMSLLRNVIPTPPRISVLAGAAFLSFLLAVATWWCVERPFRRVRLAPPTVLVRYALAISVVGAVPAAISVLGGVPTRLSTRTRDLEAAVTLLRQSACLVMSGTALSDDASCREVRNGRATLAIFGDSHAWAIAPRLRQLADRQKLGFQVFARARCPPLLGVSIRDSWDARLPSDCAAFKAAALSRMLDDPHIATVVLAANWSGPLFEIDEAGYSTRNGAMTSSSEDVALLRQGLVRTITALTKAGKRVVILQDVPRWSFDPLKIALDNSMPARDWVAALFDPDVHAMSSGSVPLGRVLKRDDFRAVITNLATPDQNVEVVDPIPNFCNPTRCRFASFGKSLFFDDNHVTPMGAAVALHGTTLEGR